MMWKLASSSTQQARLVDILELTLAENYCQLRAVWPAGQAQADAGQRTLGGWDLEDDDHVMLISMGTTPGCVGESFIPQSSSGDDKLAAFSSSMDFA